jgi:hypothetical protein
MAKQLCCLLAVTAIAFGVIMQRADAATIYSETFSGAGTADLNGTAPDSTTDGNTWTASSLWNKDGTVDAGSGDHNAFLAFTPNAGNVYTLSATLDTPSGASWAAIGFVEGANVSTDFWQNITSATVPWVLYRSSTNVDSFIGRVDNWTTQDEGDHSGPSTFSIVLDTQGAAWTAEWFINSASVRSETLASNPTGITHVGLGRESGTDANFDSFSLTVVPEPSTLCLATLGLLALIGLGRRHKR